jgi:predicted glutamine amidotransferase
MNCNVPTDICFSFTGFRQRGGATDQHSDGWGIAFFEGYGCRLFLDAEPAVHSPVAELVRNYPIRSVNVIAHIRKATKGAVCLENTHPFMRELWGRYWIFAHNGTLHNFAPRLRGDYRPVGTTDSELAFCCILETLRDAFPAGMPSFAGTGRIAGISLWNWRAMAPSTISFQRRIPVRVLRHRLSMSYVRRRLRRRICWTKIWRWTSVRSRNRAIE